LTDRLEFWFSLGSTYTYLSVNRCNKLCAERGIEVLWRPFQLRTILEELAGMPFVEGSPKTRYMWHDIGRQARKIGLSPVLPAPYPNTQAHLANRVAHIGLEDDWGESFIHNYYARWFESEAGPLELSDIQNCISRIGIDAHEILTQANSDAIIDAQVSQTDQARKLGIFGSPTFVINDEIFWGDDRLESALELAKPDH